jgi:uncharacterized DUF497 family protein
MSVDKRHAILYTLVSLKPFHWNAEKSKQLKIKRGVTFEHITLSIEDGGLLDFMQHPNPEKTQIRKY